ncbi:P-loop NTPase fold protein, partial [Escherichia coli]
PTETFQVLRLVKAVADFSRTSFLLAFDPNYLISVLDKNNIVNSSEYLNKIVQLRVPLPVISERGMNELANAELEKIANKSLTDRFESDQERLSWIYHNYFKKLIKNPRELKRFFNHLRFVLEQIEGQVCFSDLFALSLVATKSSLVYEHIKSTPEAYIGKRFTNDGLLMDKPQDIVDRFSDERNKKLSNFSDQERSVMQELLGDIFPLLQSSGYSHYGVSDPDTAGRVSAPQRLHIAFHYKTPAGYISDHDIISFINGDVKRNEFLRDVLSQNAEERFFEMMNNYSSYCKDNSFEILTCIYDTFLFSQELKSSLERNYGFLTKDLYRRMNWLTNKVISESDDKYALLDDRMGVMELLSPYIDEVKSRIENIESVGKLGDEKAVMYVEGASDKIIIERAIQVFIPERMNDIEVITKDFGAGTNYVCDMLKAYYHIHKHHQNKYKCVGIVDADKDGINVKKELGDIQDIGKSVKCFTLKPTQDVLSAKKDGYKIPGVLESNYPIAIWKEELEENNLERRANLNEMLTPEKVNELIQSEMKLSDNLKDKDYSIKIEYLIPKKRKIPLAKKIAQMSDDDCRESLRFLEKTLKEVEAFLFT